MPGTTHCGRCRASLQLANAPINVYPPRASKWAKAWRKSLTGRLWYAARVPARGLSRRLEFDTLEAYPGLGALLRLLIPGWPQLAEGRVWQGQALLAVFLLSGFGTLVGYGTLLATFFIAILITTHFMSVYDIASRGTKQRFVRLSRCLLGFAGLGLFVYLPLFNLIPQVAAPFSIRAERPPLRANDVLLANLWANPRVGDVVLYNLNQLRVQGSYLGRNAILEFQGQRVDRVLAGPGQFVVWDGRTLTVDDQPSALRPLNPMFAGLPVSLRIPPGHFFILPSGEPMGTMTTPREDFVRNLALVPKSSIEGRVYWRCFPWWRMGRVQ